MNISDNAARAKSILGGKEADAGALFKLAKSLKGERQFDYARRILARAHSDPKINDDPVLKNKIIQQHALCTYKDQDLSAHERLNTALNILNEIQNFGNTTAEKQETLGLYGAIYKRKWEVDGQKLNLERSLLYYLSGHNKGHIRENQGYTSINAAFMLDLLAHQEEAEKFHDKRLSAELDGGREYKLAGAGGEILETGRAKREGDGTNAPAQRREQAREIRRMIVETLKHAPRVEMVEEEPKEEGRPKVVRKKKTNERERNWWLIVTTADAYFGLGEYDSAREWLREAADLHEEAKEEQRKAGEPVVGVEDWEWESTLRQLVTLARIRGEEAARAGRPPGEQNRAWEVLDDFIGWRFGATGDGGRDGDGDGAAPAEGARRAKAAMMSARIGKVGLGLSGGGFRASFYHIGVLAKLAELDVLRHVEVLSCVSGGSIVGAHYYLELRRLLRQKPDGEVSREDYVDIVQRVERDFLAGVQRNIRSRIAAEFWTNLRLAFSRTYTRTNRVGELYERELYARVADGEGSCGLLDPAPPVDAWTGTLGDREGCGAPDPLEPVGGWTGAPLWLARIFGRGERPRWLNGLYIAPAGEERSFRPKYDNWRRSAKVPMLVINATTLNTGHNWHFTASYMGEPPAGLDAEVDVSDRFRRMYYGEAPGPYQRVRLGYAVAASACVPGLFEPLVLDRLYPDRTVRLVDGGVQDNQGISAILEQDCNVVLVSDASGQMESVKDPRSGFVGRMFGGVLGVLLRTKDVLMARVREAQYEDLAARRRSSLLRGMMYVHLTKDLDKDPVDWIGCDDPRYATEEALPVSRRGPRTRYGNRKEVQRLLSSIRTDLDSFTDVEAYALMASGYRMTEYEFPKSVKDFPGAEGPAPNWKFLAVEERMRTAGDDPTYQSLLKQLQVAGSIAFKVWRLSVWLQILAGLLALTALVAAGYAALKWLTPPAFDEKLSTQLVAALKWWNLDPTFGQFLTYILTTLLALAGGFVLGNKVMSVVQYRKTMTRMLIHVGMSLFGFLVARLHVHAFDRLYLRAGGIRLKPDIFLCYVHEDAALAGRLDEWLRRQGLKTVVDGKDTLFSRERARLLRRLIENSGAVVFVSSPSSNPSKVCGHHIAHANTQGVQVIYADISGRAAAAPGNGSNGGRAAGAGHRHEVVYLGPDGEGKLIPAELERLLRRIKGERDPSPAPHAPHASNGNGVGPAPAEQQQPPPPGAPGQTEAAPAAVEKTETETVVAESPARDDAAPAASRGETLAPAQGAVTEPVVARDSVGIEEGSDTAAEEPAPAGAEGNGSKPRAESVSRPAPVTPEGTGENPKR